MPDWLIAEDLLLLLLDDESGTVTGTGSAAVALGGAVLVELALAGAVEREAAGHRWRPPVVRAVDGRAPADPVLREAYDRVAARPASARRLVQQLGRGLPDVLGDRLVERGVLSRREGRLLGVVPRTRRPAVDPSHEREVRAALTAVLVHDVAPDDRTGALVALLSALGRAAAVVDRGDVPARQVRARAKVLSQGDWAADAVREVVDAVTAAVAAAAVTAATTGVT